MRPRSDSKRQLISADWSRVLVWVAVIFWLIVRLHISWGRYFGQDEFESLHQGWLLFAGATQFVDFNSNHPPLFFYLLSLVHYGAGDPVTSLFVGRGLTFLSSAVQLLLVHRIGRSTFGGRAARWAVIAYATSATYLEWSTEIRTDALLVPLWLGAVALFVGRGSIPPKRRLFWIGLLLGLAFWSNQKALAYSVPLVVFVLVGGPGRAWRARDVWIPIVGASLPTALFLGLAALQGSLDELIRLTMGEAMRLTSEDPYRVYRGLTLEHTVLRDAGFVVLGAAAMLWAARRRGFDKSQQFVLGTASWMALTFLFTPGPFHYYLLSVFPLLAVAVGGFLGNVLAPARMTARRRWVTAAAVAVYLVPPVIRLAKFAEPTNAFQRQVITIGAALAPPATPVFDGAGALIQRPDAYGFHWILWGGELARYRAGELPPLVETVRENGLRLILHTYRIDRLPAGDLGRLLTYFPRRWGPLRVPGYDSRRRLVGREPVEFELWYDGTYEVEPPGLLVDGERVEGPVRLAAGRHTVSVPGGFARARVIEVVHGAVLPDEPDRMTFFAPYGYGY